jgi:hypothetical protein
MQFCRILNVGLSTLLCAALTSTIAPAATLRMVIQSHPDVGGKCLSVPNRQFVEGMHLHMFDCHNTPAQIFVYDEQSQQLTIGNLCVESWGRGDPQDAVGLGSCSGQANQHWKMVASGNYYQIIGINNRCLEVRYGVKDNRAPLDMMDCDATRAQRLWALIEAAPADALGSVWDETDAGGWTAVWTRRGDTNAFDATFANSDGRKVTTVNFVTINGNNININRTASSDGILCTYTGILIGAKVSGTFACNGHGAGQWQVTIR